MVTKRITKEHTAVLKALQHVGNVSAIIAGGAVRDTYFSKPISDIDIFIFDPVFSGKQRVNQLTTQYVSNLMGGEDVCDVWELYHTMWSSPAGGTTNRFVTQIINLFKDGTDYQLISLKIDPVEYVKKYFDVGLCMAYCDGKRMRFTERFLTDANNKTITLCGDLNKEEYDYATKNHIPRIRNKYPDFVVKVDPELHANLQQ